MPIRKIARIIEAAGKDADRARRTGTTPEFRKAVMKDRRSALSEFTTVKDALRDREALERKAAARGGRKSAANRPKAGKARTSGGRAATVGHDQHR